MTIASVLSQSRSDFSISVHVSAILKYHPQFAKSSSKPGAQQPPLFLPPCSAWTVPETSRHRQEAKGRQTRRPARRRTTGIERRAEECWRSWSRGAVKRRSGLWSQRMNSGRWEKILPQTMSLVSGLLPRVSYGQLKWVKSLHRGHQLPMLSMANVGVS